MGEGVRGRRGEAEYCVVSPSRPRPFTMSVCAPDVSLPRREKSAGLPRMKSHRQELWFEVPARRAFLNITPEVEAAVRQSGIQEGFCLVNAMHISASCAP